MDASSPNDTLTDVIFGGATADTGRGGGGADVLIGAGGLDLLIGGTGNDSLYGGTGADQLDGGDGNDTLFGLDGAVGDFLKGGTGFDTYYADWGDSISDDGESANSGIVFAGAGLVQLTGGTRQEGESFYRSADGQYRYSEGALGAIYVQRLSGGPGIIVQAPVTPISGRFEDSQVIVTGRPDLGISLTTIRDSEPTAAKPSLAVKRLFDLARLWRPTGDPLALDIGGNGFETVGDLGEDTVLFDHDGNGVRNGTGWRKVESPYSLRRQDLRLFAVRRESSPRWMYERC